MDEGYDKKLNLILNQLGIRVKTISSASGTASPSILDYFGLVETKKNMYMAVIPEHLTKRIFSRLKTYLKLNQRGKGIAFTVPISSSNKFLSETLSKNIFERSKPEMKKEMDTKYHLVITIVAEGYLEKVMSIAKKIGGVGGTVLKGRELSNIIPKKILGFNIESEREIILNIVPEDDRKKIMEEISKEVGIKTKAKGVCLSVPVEDIMGFELYK